MILVDFSVERLESALDLVIPKFWNDGEPSASSTTTFSNRKFGV
jgi:hypothetical protein